MRKETESYEQWVARRRRPMWWLLPLCLIIPWSPWLLRDYFGLTSASAGALSMAASLALLLIYGIHSWREAEADKAALRKKQEEEFEALFKASPHN
ncbi:MAG: hypothetical protein JWN98_2318 [Abditibacteriota bacterium]|jgi:hypothetical protein|nr:hypothetical protein [Abditibacteriota bacterium]